MRRNKLVKREIEERAASSPFEPFRIGLNSGHHVDVFFVWQLVPVKGGVFVAMSDGNTITFPYRSISSIESLIEGL